MLTLITNLLIILIVTIGIYCFNLLLSVYVRIEELNIIPSEAPRHHFYDYIIVGVGTGGSTILSELNCGTTTLVIEAGTYPIPVLMDIPILTPLFHQTIYDWEYETVPQKYACKAMKNSQCNLAAGKGFGGSNIINNLIYHRGMPEDYRGWFDGTCLYNYTNDIEPFFIMNEDKLKPEYLDYMTSFGREFLTLKIHHLNFEIPKVLQKNGRRSSPVKCVKKLNCRMKNIEYLHNALVTKIIFSGDENAKRAVGVEYEKYDEIYTVYSRKAIILSAGTIGTPKILLQSGVGPCTDLRRLGIDCIVNLPGVGKNLQDHIGTGLDLVEICENLGLSPVSLLSISNLLQYFHPFSEHSHGPLTTVGCEILGFVDNGEKLGFLVLPMGMTSDYGVRLKNILNLNQTYWCNHFEELIYKQTVSIVPILLHPKSRGIVKLKDSNPRTPPFIDPQYLSHPDDMITLLNGIKWLKRILHTRQMQSFQAKIDDRLFPACNKFTWDSKEYWTCYITYMSFSLYHPVGTCRLGEEHDPETVVLRNFQVKDIDGLYIVDASLMPNLPSGNINAAVAMLARKFLDTFGQL